jgi:hypothetical protein
VKPWAWNGSRFKKTAACEDDGEQDNGAIEPIRGWPGLHRTPFQIGGSMVGRYASINATDDAENGAPLALR